MSSVFKRLFGTLKKEAPKDSEVVTSVSSVLSPRDAIPQNNREVLDEPSASSRALDNMLSDYLGAMKPSVDKLRVILDSSVSIKKQELLRSSLLPLFLKSVATQFSQQLVGNEQLDTRLHTILEMCVPTISDPSSSAFLQPFNATLFQRLQLLVVNEECASAINEGHLRYFPFS
jgi:hypothetical protein